MDNNQEMALHPKKLVIIALLTVLISAIVFGSVGFLIGRNASSSADEEFIEAYSKGWAYWFGNYGSHHEGLQYVGQYTLGRQYGHTFDSQYAAFEAGYKDAFFHCNQSDPDSFYDESIKRGYQEYYGE